MNFLLRRPIAVVMAFFALFILGIVAYRSLPVTLLPNIVVPQITIQVSKSESSAREIEQSIITPIRRQLLQVAGLANIESKTRDGMGIIELRLEYGVNADLAYIEVNEKIDAIMSSLPQGTPRPKTIKANATDVPVFYLNITVNKESNGWLEDVKFIELCDIVDNVIRRRIEQLPEVAIADISGVASLNLLINPDEEKMKSFGLTRNDIETILTKNNVDVGSMSIRDGELEFAIRMSTLLHNENDVANIYVNIGDRYIQLKDICKVEIAPQKENGCILINGKKGVSIAVISKSGEAIESMIDKVSSLTKEFQDKFPDYKFEVMRNQTQLLDYTISNLEQNLLLSFILILVIGWLFLGGFKHTIVVVIALGTTIVLSFIPMYCADKTLNIISLSGLILVVGMMIDNALIVTENITQWYERGKTLREACRLGTTEMVTPLLSSSLTTVSVFIPLLFISDIALSIFGDQAFVICVGLFVSYLVGVVLLPIVYHQLFASSARNGIKETKDYLFNIMRWYETCYQLSFRNKRISIAFILLMIPIGYILFLYVGKDKMPQVDYDEVIATVEWGENVSLRENKERTESLIASLGEYVVETSASVGSQSFVVDRTNELSTSEVELYVKLASSDNVNDLQLGILDWLKSNFKNAFVKFTHPATVFERIFDTGEADVKARIVLATQNVTSFEIKQIENKIKTGVLEKATSQLSFNQSKLVVVNRRALEHYGISLYDLQNCLLRDIKGGHILELHSYSSFMPVAMASRYKDINEVIKNGCIQMSTRSVPYANLIQLYDTEDLKFITAGKEGEYLPIEFDNVDDVDELCSKIDRIVLQEGCKVSFSGAHKSSSQILKQLIAVLIISFLLMYFILCAQFESFIQPLIVLVEIPIDITFALFVLLCCGETLNLMSAIGITVSCGIIVNDSILKIDTINELRRRGIELKAAIHEAGRRRLRAIVMTSLTTIGAMLPVLFASDLGSQIQKSLAIAMISTMVLGTLVSLYIVPLIYFVVENRHK